MKKQKLNLSKKLVLRKETIIDTLTSAEQQNVEGGFIGRGPARNTLLAVATCAVISCAAGQGCYVSSPVFCL